MIPTIRLLYRLDQKLNNLASNADQQIPLEDKILALNEAQLRLIRKKTTYRDPESIKDLQNLVILFQDLTPVAKGPAPINHYEASLPSNYYMEYEVLASCSQTCCSGRKVWIENVVDHHDVGISLLDPHRQPSFQYQTTFATIDGDKIKVFSEDPKGAFVVDKIYFSYLKYPTRIDFAGYTNFDGTPSTTVDCELIETVEDELLEIATEELAFRTGNLLAAQASQVQQQKD